MIHKINNIQLKTIFYFAYILMLFGWMFEKVIFINKFLPFIRILSYLLLIVIILYNYKKFSFKKLLINVGISILMIITSIQSGSNTLLLLWLFILASEKIDFSELVKIDMITKVVFTFMIILLYYLGLTEQTQFHTYLGETRNALGFGNPNTFGYYIFSICADYIYLNSKKLKFKHLILLCLISYFVSTVSESRTSSILIILLGLVSLISSNLKVLTAGKKYKFILNGMFIIFTLFSVYLALNYDNTNSIHIKLNEILSGRIINSHRYINNYRVNLFGQQIGVLNWDGSYTYYLDNAYLKLLLNYGLCSYFLIMFIYFEMIKKASYKQNVILMSLILIYFIYGMTENVMFWLTGNVFLLYAFCNNNTKKEESN